MDDMMQSPRESKTKALVMVVAAMLAFVAGVIALQLLLSLFAQSISQIFGSATSMVLRICDNLLTILVAFPIYRLVMKIGKQPVSFRIKPQNAIPGMHLIYYLLVALIAVTLFTAGSGVLMIMGIMPGGFSAGWAPGNIVYTIVFGVVLMPVLQEVMFRGIMLNRLKAQGALLAILVSSLLFAISHLDVANALLSFIPGCVLSFVAYRSGGIAYSAVMHMVINLLGTFLFPLLFASKNEGVVIAATAVASVLFVAGMAVYVIKRPALFDKVPRQA